MLEREITKKRLLEQLEAFEQTQIEANESLVRLNRGCEERIAALDSQIEAGVKVGDQLMDAIGRLLRLEQSIERLSHRIDVISWRRSIIADQSELEGLEDALALTEGIIRAHRPGLIHDQDKVLLKTVEAWVLKIRNARAAY